MWHERKATTYQCAHWLRNVLRNDDDNKSNNNKKIIIIIIIIIYLIVAAHSEVHLTQANPTEPEGVDEQCVI